MYYKERPEDNTYARPVEGVRVVVDLLKQCVAVVGCGGRGLIWMGWLVVAVGVWDGMGWDGMDCLPQTTNTTNPPHPQPPHPPQQTKNHTHNTPHREVVDFLEEARGVRVAAPDEARYMVYTPPQLQRTDLKDLVIVQPEGPSFALRGNHLSWQNWNLRLGFTTQEVGGGVGVLWGGPWPLSVGSARLYLGFVGWYRGVL